MTQVKHQPQQEKVHPFDLDKSDFEKLLERDFPVRSIEEAQAEAEAAQHMDHFRRALYIARAIDRLRQNLQPVMWMIMPLQNTQLGFKTDKQDGYSDPVVLECVIEAILNRANLSNNEINIISGRCYLTKNYYDRRIEELEGLENFVAVPSVPQNGANGAIVDYTATGVYKGAPFSLSRKLAIRVNNGMGADAILGKAQRKFYKWVLETLTKTKISVPDADGDDTTIVPLSTPANSRLADVQAANGNGHRQAPPPPPPPSAQTPEPPAAATEPPASRTRAPRRSAPQQNPPEPEQTGAEADTTNYREIAQMFAEQTPVDQLRTWFGTQNGQAMARAKVLAKLSGPADEQSDPDTRKLAFYVRLNELETAAAGVH